MSSRSLYQSEEERVIFRSGSLLKDRLRLFFKDQPWCYYDPIDPDFQKEWRAGGTQETLNCVLIGHAVRRFRESMAWPEGRYKIWVLSEANRRTLYEVFQIPISSVGLVPRYKLFPIQKSLRELSIGVPTDFVFGGRFASAKGILHLVELTSLLQTRYDLPIHLKLCGRYSQMIPHNRPLRIPKTDYRKQVESFIQQLPWQVRPDFDFESGPEEWIQQNFENPVFISLSQHTHEDFGVSLAQAQSLGWPTILSSWGAHFDAVLPNTFLLPKFDVWSEVLKRKWESRELARSLVENFKYPQKNQSRCVSYSEPKTFRKSELLRFLKNGEKRFPGLVIEQFEKYHSELDKIMSGFF